MPTFVTEGPVTKSYVDTTAQGLHVLTPVKAATTANITLSNEQTIDGISVGAGARVLVKDQSTGSENGIYICVDEGSWTRTDDFNTNKNIRLGDFVFCEQGTVNAGHGFVMTGDASSGKFTSSGGSGDVGTHTITFTQFSGLATTVAVNQGGTGQTSYTDGQLLIGNTSGNTLSKATLTEGSGISITNGNGSITIASSGGGADNVFKTIAVSGQPDVVADSATDTLTLVAGTNVSITTNAGTDSITITSTDNNTTYTAGNGLDLTGTSFSLDLKASGGLTIDSTELTIDTSADVSFNSLGIGMNATGTEGQIDATGDIIAFSSSDKRLKTNIQPIQDPLTKLQKIGGYTFDWIPKQGIHSHTGNDIGVIAQEIEEVLPEITTTRDNGYKAVKYEKLTAYLIECVKAQQTHIQQLEDRLVKLEK